MRETALQKFRAAISEYDPDLAMAADLGVEERVICVEKKSGSQNLVLNIICDLSKTNDSLERSYSDRFDSRFTPDGLKSCFEELPVDCISADWDGGSSHIKKCSGGCFSWEKRK